MRKFYFVLSVLLGFFVSCSKESIHDEDNIASLVFNNTVECNGVSYPIVEIECDLEDYTNEEDGYSSPFFWVEGSGMILLNSESISLLGGEGISKKYEGVCFAVGIPISKCGKIYNLLEEDVEGCTAFGKGNFIETEFETGGKYIHDIRTEDVPVTFYIKNTFGERSGIIFGDEDNPISIAKPHVVKYYFDILDPDRETFVIYVSFEDCNGTKYTLSYKGSNIE